MSRNDLHSGSGFKPWRPLLLFGLIAASLALLSFDADADATVGAWGAVQTLPWRPIHSILLPTGKVLFYQRGDDARLWDPATGSLTTPPKFGYNSFCSGHSQTGDGLILITGGHISNGHGLPRASYYNPFANTFARLPDMNAGRWYPTQVTLANGDVVTMSGDQENGARNLIPQVWQVSSGSWRSLTGASLSTVRYPAAFLAPNGKVFVATATSRYLNTAGSGAWTTVANRLVSSRDSYGSAAMYEVGKVIYTGGGAPASSSEVIDLNAATPAWSAVSPMPKARRQHNATVLPDGRVLVTGGSSSVGFNTEDGPKPAIVWDPVLNRWTTWATESEYRGYHSEAVLLADGRVASIGGEHHPNLQVFSPPFLFMGARPTISAAPSSVALGATFFVSTPDAPSISKVTWTRLSSVTHTKNMDQRINVLSFAPASGGLNVTAPSSANACPPGYYMLWLLNASGVPAPARIVRVRLS
ncbi:MAG: galactose oxidase-like domain-containing protein [Gammaproteobacteria bacterium]